MEFFPVMWLIKCLDKYCIIIIRIRFLTIRTHESAKIDDAQLVFFKTAKEEIVQCKNIIIVHGTLVEILR